MFENTSICNTILYYAMQICAQLRTHCVNGLALIKDQYPLEKKDSSGGLRRGKRKVGQAWVRWTDDLEQLV